MNTQRATSRIYLDYNATAPCRQEAAEAMASLLLSEVGNPSSLHREGQRARAHVEEARERIAGALGAEPGELVFTGGGTESDNLAIRGAVAASTRSTPHLVTTAVEHPAVLEVCRLLENQGVARLSVVACDATGRVDSGAVEHAVEEATILVSVMLANNEVGTLQPVAEIAERVRRKGVLLHCDAVQAIGRIPVNLSDLGADLVSISAHKIGGPMGVGGLFIRNDTPCIPLLIGGAQERGRRAGTENVAAIVGFAHAVEAAVADQESEARRLDRLRRRFLARIEPLGDVILNGDLANSLPNTLNVSFGGLSGEDLMAALDLEGVAVSTGSACAVGAGKSSHVIAAMAGDGDRGCGPLRISLGHASCDHDVERGADRLVRR